MKISKKPIRVVLLLLPLIFSIAILYYFSYLLNYYNDRFVTESYSEKKENILSITDKFNKQRKIYDNWNKEVVDDFLADFIQQMDEEPGVYARIISLDFSPITEGKFSKEEKELLEVFSPIQNESYEFMCKKLRENQQGETEILINGMSMKIFWVCYPKEDTRCYVVMGIVPDILSEMVGVNQFMYGIVAMIIALLATIYINIYFQSKHKIGLFNE